MSEITMVEQPTVVTQPKQKRKVCLIGFAPTWNEAPFGDKSFEFWGVNEVYMILPQNVLTRLYDLHDYRLMKSKQRNDNHLEVLRSATIPILMQKHYLDRKKPVEWIVFLNLFWPVHSRQKSLVN